jgi:hypothetical protein
MRKLLVATFLITCLAICASAQGPASPQYKAAEVTHFTASEGVELTPEFYDFLYAELKAELQKKKVVEQIIGEGEVVDAADAPTTLSIGGSVLEYKKGSVAKAVLIGFGTGRRSLRSQVKIVRLSDKQAVFDQELTVKFDPRWDNKQLARQLAGKIANELKQTLK